MKIIESLEIESEIEKINKNFRKYVEQVFSKIFLKKIDRVFKKKLIVQEMNMESQANNIVAITVGENIYLNMKLFKEYSTEKAMMYIIHELLHVLYNKKQFPEIRTVLKQLAEATMRRIPPDKINEFLTGKKQSIHSNPSLEYLSYCSNAAFKWSICPELKQIYKDILSESGLFDMDSSFWKKRF